MTDEVFRLSAPPPVRALAIAAGAALVAIVALALGLTGRLTGVLTVVCVVLLVFALLLAGGAVVLTRRLRTTVGVDADTITVRRGRQSDTRSWTNIGEVTLEGARLTFVAKDGADLGLINPRGPQDPTFKALLGALRKRLDTNRGYTRHSL